MAVDEAVISRQANRFYSERWAGHAMVAAGALDPAFGVSMMAGLASTIKGCRPLMVIPDAGHFLPEQGKQLAHDAASYFDHMIRTS